MSPTYLLEAASPLRLCDTPCKKEDISEALSPFSATPKLLFELAQCEGATSSIFARFSLSIPTTKNPYHDATDFPFIANPADPFFSCHPTPIITHPTHPVQSPTKVISLWILLSPSPSCFHPTLWLNSLFIF